MRVDVHLSGCSADWRGAATSCREYICEQLALSPGSSYAQAVYELRYGPRPTP